MKPKQHFLEQHDPDRKDFQIDRIILFSDAVFAIAITLLIIEIKAPEVAASETHEEILKNLLALTPKFIGFIVSFFVIAIYWRSHHRIFGFVSHYSEKLIWVNVFFLFTIVLMPFSSAYYSENFAHNIPYYFYSCNIILTGIANLWLMNTVFSTKNNLVSHPPTAGYLHLFKARSYTTPLLFLFGVVVCQFSPLLSRFCFILPWPVLSVFEIYFKRKYRDELNDTPVTTPVKQKKSHR